MPIRIYTTIDDPLAASNSTGQTVALGINGSGQIVGYWSYGDTIGRSHSQGFLLSGGTYTIFDDPSASVPRVTQAFGINSEGQIVGDYTNPTNNEHGFLYSGGIYTTLDDPLAGMGATTVASGINNADQIVGTYADVSGGHGFLLTIAPNPPSPAGTTADMILRDGLNGRYEIYDIGNNAIVAGDFLGQAAINWAFVTLGGFNGSDTTDMLLRNVNTGGLELYDISNQITGAFFLGNVGLDWQFAGIAPVHAPDGVPERPPVGSEHGGRR